MLSSLGTHYILDVVLDQCFLNENTTTLLESIKTFKIYRGGQKWKKNIFGGKQSHPYVLSLNKIASGKLHSLMATQCLIVVNCLNLALNGFLSYLIKRKCAFSM